MSVEIDYFRDGFRCKNDFVHMNCVKNGAVRIEFKTDALKKSTHDVDSEHIQSVLFKNIGCALEDRNFYYKGVEGEDEAQIQLQSSRVFMSKAEAVQFAEAVDALYPEYQKLDL